MSRRQTVRLLVSAVMVAALIAGPPAHADFADGVRQFFGRTDQTPHPSIVQVLAPEPGALARGSGTLIHVDGDFGYVISNWHVVRDAPGDVVVIFPDGHQSLARVLKTDESWDLALLLIWRGDSAPMPLSSAAPQPGEALTIAGYGGEGKFRAARGLFTTYAAPEPDMPYEMFEVSVAARQGDSGGPIVNERGELAGVLFGAGDGRTTGTQVHRVRDFVNEALREMRELSPSVAQAPLSPPIANQPGIRSPAVSLSSSDPPLVALHDPGWSTTPPPEYLPPGASPAQHGQAPQQLVTQTTLPTPTSTTQTDFSADPFRGPPSEIASSSQPREQPPSASARWANRQWESRPTQPPQLSERGGTQRDFPQQVDFGRELLPPPVASIEGPVASMEGTGPPPSIGGRRAGVPPHHGPRVPGGGITWDQLKSFFAAVGVFAVLNTVTQLLFVGKNRK